jgi:hypothetical protein
MTKSCDGTHATIDFDGTLGGTDLGDVAALGHTAAQAFAAITTFRRGQLT